MKRFYAVLFTMFALAGVANANEPVTPATPADKAPAHNTRVWQKDNDLVAGHIRNYRLAAMKNTSASIMAFFHDSVLTEGAFSPVWHGEYFPAINGGPQVHFGIRCLFNNDDNSASDNDLTIFGNDLAPLAGHLSVGQTEYTTLRGYTGNKGGARFEFNLDNGLHVKAWLVTADSTALPYTPVTRKEYLDQARQQLEDLKDVAVANARGKVRVRSAAEQEAEKQAMLQRLRETYSGVELEARIKVYLHNYMKDEDLIIQTIARDVAGYNHTIRMIDSIERNSTPQQLAQGAVVSVDAVDFHGFEDGQAGSSLLVRINPSYFTSTEDVKSLLVCFRYNPDDAHAGAIDRQLAENFNGGSLQSLIAR
ncbi:MAG TPA: hypothetical protein VHE54_15865 [Puia sp.]|nr:hypothetical protein [Puia sp.]